MWSIIFIALVSGGLTWAVLWEPKGPQEWVIVVLATLVLGLFIRCKPWQPDAVSEEDPNVEDERRKQW
jgi:hypothetical protein